MFCKKKETSLVPSLLNESLWPVFMRNFPFFDEDEQFPAKTREASNLSLWEDENQFHVEAALPGLKKEEVEVSLNKGILWIKGNSKRHEEDQKRKYYYKGSSSFSYRVAVPGEIDASTEPNAHFENGILKVSFKKQQVETPKKINITNN